MGEEVVVGREQRQELDPLEVERAVGENADGCGEEQQPLTLPEPFSFLPFFGRSDVP